MAIHVLKNSTRHRREIESLSYSDRRQRPYDSLLLVRRTKDSSRFTTALARPRLELIRARDISEMSGDRKRDERERARGRERMREKGACVCVCVCVRHDREKTTGRVSRGDDLNT